MDLIKQRLAAFQKVREKKFWAEKLIDSPARLVVEYDTPATGPSLYQLERVKLSEQVTQRIVKLGNGSEANLHVLFLAAVFSLLYRHTGQNDLIVGMPVYKADIDAATLNTLLPIRVQVEPALGFKDILLKTKTEVKKAVENREYPVELVALENRTDEKAHPFFDTLVLLEDLQDKEALRTFRPNLIFSFAIRENQTEIKVEYNSLVYCSASIKRFITHLAHLLNTCLFDLEKPLHSISLLGEVEKETILHEFNATSTTVTEQQLFQQLFEAQVQKTPTRIAVTAGQARLTYAELNKAANRVAHYLRKLGVGPETIVGLMVERSVSIAVGILGILKAGGAFLPIDPAYPETRKQLLIQASRLNFLLTERRILEENSGLERVLYSIRLDDPCLKIEEDHNPASVNRSSDLAYVIYTSGTTGTPNGVMIEHRSLSNYIGWRTQYYSLTEDDAALQLLTYSFDGFGSNFYATLTTGGKVVIADENEARNAEAMGALLTREKISHLSLVPSLYQLLLETVQPEVLQQLRFVVLAGEETAPTIIEKSKAIAPAVTLINEYGPTENTIAATAWREMEASGRAIIGKPIAHNCIYILDEARQLQPIGIPGEICIGGLGLARGYLNKPELTVEKFMPHPFARGEKLYRTGDRGKWLADGRIEFLGRLDNQLKVRGYRIALEEIEKVLLAFEGITWVTVVSRDQQTLRAYYMSEREIPLNQLMEFLRTKLPAYMLPASFVKLAAVPLTPHGKLDKAALPEPERHAHSDVDHTSETEEQKIIREIWEAVLGISHIDSDDNFFQLGGDSIKAILASSKLKAYNIHIDAKDIYDYPTITALTQRETQPEVQIDQSEIQGDVPLTPIQKWFFEKRFDASGHFNQAVMIFRREKLDQEIIRAAMEVLMFQHDALRMRFVNSDQGVRQINQAYQPGLFLMEVVAGDAVSADEINKTQAAIDLRKGPLVGLKLFRTPTGDHLLLVLHHLIVDGISWRILIEDFITLYQQLAEGAELKLPAKTHAFKEWALALMKYAAGERLVQEKKYWKAIEARQVPALPTDAPLLPSERRYQDTVEVSVCLTEKQTEELIHKIHFAYNTEINDILLAALALALKEWCGISITKVNLEGHGREALIEGLNIERTVGWFTAQSPVIIDLQGCEEISSLIRSTKETLRKVPSKGVGYSLLKYLAPQASNIFSNTDPEISFNYLGHIIEGELEGFSLSENNLGQNISPEAICPHKLLINGITARNKLEMVFTFNRKEFKRESIVALAALFKTSLADIITHCLSQERSVKTASDFTSRDLGEEELADILQQL